MNFSLLTFLTIITFNITIFLIFQPNFIFKSINKKTKTLLTIIGIALIIVLFFLSFYTGYQIRNHKNIILN